MGVGPAQRPSARANTKLCRTRPMELVSPPLLVLGRALATPNFGGQRPTRRRETRPDVGWGLGWPNAHLAQRPKLRYTMSRGVPTWHAAHSPGGSLPGVRRSSRHSEAQESQHPFLKARHRGDPLPSTQRPSGPTPKSQRLSNHVVCRGWPCRWLSTAGVASTDWLPPPTPIRPTPIGGEPPRRMSPPRG